MANEGSYSNNIEGIPLPGDMPQVQGSAVPNREDTSLLQNPDGDTEAEYAVDYFDAVESDSADEYLPSKDNQQWSPGLEDEENNYGLNSFSDQDNDWDEGLWPETQPLHLDQNQSANPHSDTDEYPENIELQQSGNVEEAGI